jgi:hypothetical protein
MALGARKGVQEASKDFSDVIVCGQVKPVSKHVKRVPTTHQSLLPYLTFTQTGQQQQTKNRPFPQSARIRLLLSQISSEQLALCAQLIHWRSFGSMDDDQGDLYPRKAQKTELSDNVNTARERTRRAAMDEQKLAADKKRKADNESYRRAKNVVKKQPGFDQKSTEEQELAVRERIEQLEATR